AVYLGRIPEPPQAGDAARGRPDGELCLRPGLRRVWHKNLAVSSVYNTYLHTGLPPGPIGQPGRASLLAALYPAKVPFFYFVAQPDGKHIFSTTYAEHLAAIRAVKRQRTAARAQPAPDR